jgi:dihydrofolate reductase
MIVSAIVAAGSNDVIGASGALPWYLPEDLRRFRALTLGHVVIMGRATHESILDRLGRPLPGRTSIVVSRPAGAADHGQDGARAAPAGGGPGVQVRYEPSVAAALATAAPLAAAAGNAEFFVIGGASVYQQALPLIQRIYLTRIHQDFDGDRFLPAGWLSGFELRNSEDGLDGSETGLAYSFLDYHRAAL